MCACLTHHFRSGHPRQTSTHATMQLVNTMITPLKEGGTHTHWRRLFEILSYPALSENFWKTMACLQPDQKTLAGKASCAGKISLETK